MNSTNSIGFGSLRNIFQATKLIDDPPRGREPRQVCEADGDGIGVRERIYRPKNTKSRATGTLGFFWTARF
jgi:hypothetical protein